LLLAGVVLGLILLTSLGRRLWHRRGMRSGPRKGTGGVSAEPLAPLSRIPRAVLYLGLVALLFVLPFFLNPYFTDVATLAGMYVALALGLNIIVGLSGLLVLGYIAFYAVGAYTYALLSVHYHVPFFLALPVGACLAFIFGILLGSPVLRLRGDYLAIVTLGFGEMTRIVLNNWDEVTGGPNGVLGIARPAVFGLVLRQPIHYYFLILIFVVITVFIVIRLNDSRIGRALMAIREDEVAAQAMGVNVTLMKLLAFALGAALAGTVGVFFAAKMTFVSPESFTFMESVMILCMVVLGGMGSIPGVIVGAIALIILPEALRQFQMYRLLVFGGAMVLMMVFRPQGLIPSTQRRRELVSEQ
jgi:branched-chain amino acid transport system permease protein